MYIVDLTEPVGIIAALCVTLLFAILGKELKKTSLVILNLALFLGLILLHAYQSTVFIDVYYRAIASKSIAVDAVMIFLSYFAYLWVDDIEAKEKNKKSIDNSLEWFWKKV